MYNLEEHCQLLGKYQLIRTQLINLPYGICKSKKKELEKQPQMAKTYFKIVKN
jgi:hypothetical protein